MHLPGGALLCLAAIRFPDRRPGHPGALFIESTEAVRDVGIQVKRRVHDALDAAGDRAAALRADILARFFSSHLAPGDILVRAGAVDSVSSLAIARSVAPLGRLIVFEPSPRAASALRAGAGQAGLDEVLDIRAATLADFNGEAEFHTVPWAAASIGLWSSAIRERAGSIAPRGLVRVARLDDALAPGTRLRVLALGLRGGEAAALRGARRALLEGRPLLLLRSARGHAAEELGALLDEAAYEAHDLLGFRLAAEEMGAAPGWLLGIPREDELSKGTLHGMIDDVAESHGLSALLA